MRTIVVGVDGSEDARVAVRWAAEAATAFDGRVVAVHAMGLLEHERGDPRGDHLLSRFDEWTDGLSDLAEARLERRLVQGDPVSALLRVAEEHDADLVVVGTRGEGARGAMLLGSTSLQLAERCPCALVIVPRAPGSASSA